MIDWIKENVVVSIVVGILLILAGIGIVSSFRPSQETNIEETAQVSSSETAQNEPSSKEETPDEKNYRTAKLKLERPYAEARSEDKKEVLKAFEEAVADIKKTKFLPNVKGTIENHFRDMKKKRKKEEESKKKLTDQELIKKWENIEEDSISKSQNQELGMEK